MKSLKAMSVVAVMLFSVSMFSGCSLFTYSESATQTAYENPQWAPPYYSGVRYYYLPDLECYYDLSTQEFIFRGNGRWFNSRSIPSAYSDYDLNNCYTVVLSVNTYKPWMRHQYYVSHYPKRYYVDYYDHGNFPYVRGFNENSKCAIYWGENERQRARSWDDENVRTNRQYKYTNEDRQRQNNGNNQETNKSSHDNRITTSNSNKKTQNNSGNNTNGSRNTTNNTVKSQTQNDKTTTRTQPTTTTSRTTTTTTTTGRTTTEPVKDVKQTETKTTDRSGNTTTDQSNEGRR